MAGPTTYPSAKQFIGVAKETTPGTAVAMVATIPLESFDPEDKVLALLDKGMRGSMVDAYNYLPGPKHCEFSGKGPAIFDSLGYLVNNILGDITTTGASAPFTHAMSLLNSGTAQPGTLTLTDYQGPPATNFARQFTGCCLSELTLTGNAESELIMVDFKGLGWASNIAAAAPTANPTTALPQASWRSQLGIGGVASGGTQDITIGDWEVKLTRKLKQIFTAQNTQNPYITQRGELSCTAKLHFTAPGAETNALLQFLNNSQPQLQWTTTNGLTLSALLALTVDMQVGAFDTSKIERGAEAVAYTATVMPMPNTTNAGASGGYSPIKITLQNALAAGTY